MADTTIPRSLTHVGVTVPDVEDAIDWYEEVLGFTYVAGPDEVEANEGYFGELCADVLGDDMGRVRIAHMATANHVGFELFEFDRTEGDTEEYDLEPGFWHVCVVDPNIEALAETIVDAGGEHFADVWELFPGQDYRMTYCKDPWGNYIEIYTHSYERIYSNQD